MPPVKYTAPPQTPALKSPGHPPAEFQGPALKREGTEEPFSSNYRLVFGIFSPLLGKKINEHHIFVIQNIKRIWVEILSLPPKHQDRRPQN